MPAPAKGAAKRGSFYDYMRITSVPIEQKAYLEKRYNCFFTGSLLYAKKCNIINKSFGFMQDL